MGEEPGSVALATRSGRWVLATAVLGSGMVFLDSTVVNVALPTIGRQLHAGLAGLQWTVNAYLLTLASLILVGGSLGDRFGRRRVFVIGTVWFAAASVVCGLAPNIASLVAARALQGIGGALLTPGSLALMQATFRPEDRARAIGAWSGLAGVSTAIAPLLGGWLVTSVSWRAVFLLNLPFALVVVLAAARHVPESSDPLASHHIDWHGATAGAVGLGGVTYALIEAPGRGLDGIVAGSAAIGALGLIAFVVFEARGRNPMMPLVIFANRQFSAANAVTFAVWGALGSTFFLLVVFLQTVMGYSALRAGAATLPITALLLALSSRAGALATRVGPRIPMTVGPLVAAAGVVLFSRFHLGTRYVTGILPAVVVFGVGLSLTVAPVTATVLAAIETRYAGTGSGVNNAVARAASLLAVAVIPLVAGLKGDDYRHPAAFTRGFHNGMLLTAALTAAGGLIALAFIRDHAPPTEPDPSAAGTAEAQR